MNKPLTPYYQKNNKYFFRYKKQRMTIERKAKGVYEVSGDIIQDIPIQIITDETIYYGSLEIKVANQ